MNEQSQKKFSTTLFADLGLIYSAAIWGSTFIVVKQSLDEIHPVTLVAYRFLIAAGLMLVYLAMTRKNPLKELKKGALLGAILFLLYVPQTIGLGITTAANSAFITGLFTAFVPFLSILILKKKPRKAQWIAVLISLIGLWMLTGGLKKINPGDLITLSAAFTYACHIMFSDRYISDRIDVYILSFQQFLTTGLLSLAVAFIFNLPLGANSNSALNSAVFLAIFPTLSAFVIQFKAQQFTAPVKVSLIFALEPVFGAVFAWTYGREDFVLLQALGGLLIFVSILISTVEPKAITQGRHSA
jgi:drug/metabolite transporter (DMT)-like permease